MNSEQDQGGWALAWGVVVLAVAAALGLSACGHAAEAGKPSSATSVPAAVIPQNRDALAPHETVRPLLHAAALAT